MQLYSEISYTLFQLVANIKIDMSLVRKATPSVIRTRAFVYRFCTELLYQLYTRRWGKSITHGRPVMSNEKNSIWLCETELCIFGIA